MMVPLRVLHCTGVLTVHGQQQVAVAGWWGPISASLRLHAALMLLLPGQHPGRAALLLAVLALVGIATVRTRHATEVFWKGSSSKGYTLAGGPV